MTNKYLEKISGIISNVIKPVLGATRDVVGGVARDVGHSAHTALGGGYRDAAVAKGITNQKKLRGIHDPKSYLRATKPKAKPLSKAVPGEARPAGGKGPRKAEIKNLQSERKKAIVKTIGYGTAGAYGANKLLDKITGKNEPQYY